MENKKVGEINILGEKVPIYMEDLDTTEREASMAMGFDFLMNLLAKNESKDDFIFAFVMISTALRYDVPKALSALQIREDKLELVERIESKIKSAHTDALRLKKILNEKKEKEEKIKEEKRYH